MATPDVSSPRRFRVREVAAACLVVAALAGLAGRKLRWDPSALRSQPSEPPLEVATAQQLGEKGAAVWMELQRRYGTKNSRNAEEWVVRDYFQDRRGGVYLDVGAADPREWNNTYFLETTLGWRGLAIDAQSDFVSAYAQQRPRTRFFSLFVSDVSDAVEDFYVPANGPLGASSNKAFAERDEGPVEARKVRTVTLNDLLEREGVDHVDFLSMDIELAEPKALAGFDIEKYRTALACVESHPQVRQALLDYFHQRHYVLAGKYLGVDAQNLYFIPDSATRPTGVPSRQ